MPSPVAASECVGDYELLEQIGRGGMGIVFRARDRRLNRVVALKLILAGKLASEIEVKRFRTEAEAAAHLEHPNIVPIYEVGESEGRHFFTMKFMEGGSLSDPAFAAFGIEWQKERDDSASSGTQNAEKVKAASALRSATAIQNENVAALLVKVARAIHHAHERGILHRDLKPANILLDTNGDPAVTDFGLARRLEGENGLTLSGTVIGSPSYMAPEQAGAREITIAADIYSLGAVMFHLLTGRAPFAEESAVATMRAVIERDAPRPSDLNWSVNRDLETICLKCLEKAPARRYRSAAEFADDLERFLRGEPIQARPSGPWERIWKWAKRRPTAAGLVIVSVAALAGFFVLQLINESRLKGERDHARQQENAARSSEAITRQNLYAADMFLAHRAIEEGNLALARRTLEAHRPRPGEEDLRGFEWRYLWRQSQGEQLHVLRGFSNAVTCVTFSPDGRWLAAAGGNMVQWWNASNQVLNASLAHDANLIVGSICFSADNRTLWTGDSLGKVRFWVESIPERMGLISRGTRFVQVAAPAGAVNYLAFGERNGTDGKASGAIALYTFLDALARNERGNALTNSGGLAAFSRDGKFLLSGGGTSPTSLWNLTTGESRKLLDPDFEVTAIALSLDGHWAAACTHNSYGAVIINLVTGQQQWIQREGVGSIGTPAFSPDGGLLALPCADHTVLLLRTETGKEDRRFLGHTAEVLAVAFSPDGQTVASASRDRTVRLWSLAPKTITDTLANAHRPHVFSPNGQTLTAATSDVFPLSFQQFDVKTGHCKGRTGITMQRGTYPLSATVDTSAPLQWFLYGGATSNQWAKFQQFMLTHTNHSAVACAEDGSLLALGSKDGLVRLWHNFKAARLPTISTHTRGLSLLALSSDGRLVASVARSNILAVWDTATGTNCFRTLPDEIAIRSLAFSPDGKILASGYQDTTIQLQDAMTGTPIGSMAGHHVAVTYLAFSPDGRTLVSCASQTIKLWHIPTRREVVTLTRSGPADRPLFSPDGTTLLTSHWTGGAQLWRAPSLKEIDEQP